MVKMKIFSGFNIPQNYYNSIILIGNFDGIHLGHQILFKRAREFKKIYKCKIGVVTFNPMPKMFFNKKLKNFKSLKQNKVEEADYIICTGLFDEHESLKFYEEFLSPLIKKEMICTNPDLIVDRGDITEYCAGSVAKVFEEIGGKVKYFGKPYPLVYEKSINNKNKSVLCIGDNLNTDIRGANVQNFNSLFILNGIHKNENQNELNKLFEKYQVNVNYIQDKLKW